MIKVTPRARRSDDRAGDPLDGLVNLFDLGIVLAVAFLLAALSSLKLTDTLAHHGLTPIAPATITISPGQTVHKLPNPGGRVVGRGTKVGSVYQLPSGQLVYVTGKAGRTTAPTASAAPTGGATPAPDPTPAGTSSASSG